MTADLASLMADEPVMTDIHTSVGARSAVMARNDLRRELRPLLEAREQALLARVAELEACLNSLMAPVKTTFGATLEGKD